jgi:hypothetical protein
MILFLVAYILLLPLTVINYFVVWDKNYFKSTAIDLDKFGNREFRSLFNKTLKLKKGVKFGNEKETISSVLGKNKRDNTLSKTGIIVCYILDAIDKNHCIKSIKEL